MPNNGGDLDRVFACLANSTRRDVVERLATGPASVKELAEPFSMALPSFLQHLDVLEDAGLITSQKSGRVRTCSLNPPAFFTADNWLDKQRKQWSTRLDQLDQVLNQLNNNENS